MKAYKFRSSAQIQFTLDILLHKRLFCADWRNLNDPMEGIFAFSSRGSDNFVQKRVKGISEAKKKYKICSLATDFQFHLLWAHYAGGFDGLAIEIDLPDDDPKIKQVEYRGVFAFLDVNKVQDEEDAALQILFSKHDAWSYEKEIRIVHDQEFYALKKPISRIIAGPRMNEALQKALWMIADKKKICFCRAGIGDEGIDADPVERGAFSHSPQSRRR